MISDEWKVAGELSKRKVESLLVGVIRQAADVDLALGVHPGSHGGGCGGSETKQFYKTISGFEGRPLQAAPDARMQAWLQLAQAKRFDDLSGLTNCRKTG